jgi:hypothetical protein
MDRFEESNPINNRTGPTMEDHHIQRKEWFWRVFGIGFTVAVAVVDYVTGDEINVVFLYIVPLAIASWKLSGREAVVAAFVCTTAWLAEILIYNHPFPHPLIPYWNALMLLGIFLTVVLTLSSLKKSFAEQRRLIDELQSALTNVKMLRGLLPICSWCKRIRDDKGYWQAVETYLEGHSQAAFTHGICPECLRKVGSQRHEDVKGM